MRIATKSCSSNRWKTRASENLILTASARDSGGNTLVPSRHFTEAAQIAKAPPCKVEVHTLAADPGRAGHISESLLPALTAHHQSIALTALEDLAKCRFRFFSDRTLALKTRARTGRKKDSVPAPPASSSMKPWSSGCPDRYPRFRRALRSHLR